jgi:hypothetical protein
MRVNKVHWLIRAFVLFLGFIEKRKLLFLIDIGRNKLQDQIKKKSASLNSIKQTGNSLTRQYGLLFLC